MTTKKDDSVYDKIIKIILSVCFLDDHANEERCQSLTDFLYQGLCGFRNAHKVEFPRNSGRSEKSGNDSRKHEWL